MSINFEKVGYFRDNGSRMMNASPGQYNYTKETCAKKAHEKGHVHFALQNGDARQGWCTTSNDLDRGMSLGKAPKPTRHPNGDTGGPWVNTIYTIIPKEDVVSTDMSTTCDKKFNFLCLISLSSTKI